MNSEQITSFASFLEWCAIGLAGLMLVLAVIGIMSKTIEPARKSLLQTFMIVGALCFGAALAGEIYLKSVGASAKHVVVLSVFPNDLVDSGFPEPQVKKDNRVIDRSKDLFIEGKTTLTVDMSKALRAFNQTTAAAVEAQQEAEESRVALVKVKADVEEAEAKVRQTEGIVSELRNDTVAQSRELSELREVAAAQSRELALAQRTVTQQQQALETVAQRSRSLEQSIRALSSSTSGFQAAPSVRRLQNDLQVIDRELNNLKAFQ